MYPKFASENDKVNVFMQKFAKQYSISLNQVWNLVCNVRASYIYGIEFYEEFEYMCRFLYIKKLRNDIKKLRKELREEKRYSDSCWEI